MTDINDLTHNLVAPTTQTLAPATRTSSATGTAIDLLSADGKCWALVQVGTVAGTSPTMTVKVQEGDDSGGTDAADITGAAGAAVTASNKYQIIEFKRTKRYARAIATIAGTSPNFDVAVAIIGLKKST